MKKSLLSFLIFVVVVFLAFGQAPAAKVKWPKALIIGTPAVGTSSYAVTSAWAPVMEQLTGMKVRIMPENAPLRVRLLKQGKKINLNMESSAAVGAFAMQAKGGHATRQGGPHQVRAVWLGQSMPFGFFTRGDTGIKTLYDIKPGHKVSYFMPPPASVAACDGFLAWGKVKKEDIKVVPFGSYVPMVKAVPEGKAHLAYAPSTSSVIFEAETNPHGLHWLPLDPKKDPEGAKRFLKYRPTASFAINYQGVKSSHGVPMLLTAFYIYATDKTDDELVYNIAKWLNENFNAYKGKHPNCKLMSLDLLRTAFDSTFVPVHQGTIRYLKEVGKWTAKDDKRQKYNVALIARYEKAYNAAMAEADKKKIKVDPQNKEWVALWAGFKKDIPPIRTMMEIP